MNNKKIIVFSIVILAFILIILNIVKNRKNLDNEIFSNGSNIRSINYSYDETNSIYTIYYEDTKEVIRTTKDSSEIKMYLDNPNYNPQFYNSEQEYKILNGTD